MINLTIDGLNVSVPEGTTILEAARTAGIDIPTLCFLKDVNEVGDCRMCIVEVEGRRGFATACVTKVEEGMIVNTNSKDVSEAREVVLDLILSNHHKDCLTCVRNGNCELQRLAQRYNKQDILYAGELIEVDEKAIEEMGAKVFYAAVSQEDDGIHLSGSRALGIVASGESIDEAEKVAENACEFVKGNVYHRRDVGTKKLVNKRVEHMKEILN